MLSVSVPENVCVEFTIIITTTIITNAIKLASSTLASVQQEIGLHFSYD